MAYYIRRVPGHGYQTWKINDAVAYRMGVSNPQGGPDYFKAEAGETALETLKRKAPHWFAPGNEQFTRTSLSPGQFYPRIARPDGNHPTDFPALSLMRPADRNYVAIARSQLVALMRQLDAICQTVHPDTETFDAYGHGIRNLLILACTEVETHWKGVFIQNNFCKKNYNTEYYVQLQSAMRLGDYSISFPSFPWLAAFTPFKNWGTSDNPTQDIEWYAAYNAVKHNRENEFFQATLRNAFAAVSACAIMMIAQFGSIIALGRNTELSAYFLVSSHPVWPLSEVYMASFEDSDQVSEANYPFQPVQRNRR